MCLLVVYLVCRENPFALTSRNRISYVLSEEKGLEYRCPPLFVLDKLRSATTKNPHIYAYLCKTKTFLSFAITVLPCFLVLEQSKLRIRRTQITRAACTLQTKNMCKGQGLKLNAAEVPIFKQTCHISFPYVRLPWLAKKANYFQFAMQKTQA